MRNQESERIVYRNKGKGILRLLSASIQGGDPNHFTFAGVGLPRDLGPGETVEFIVTYHQMEDFKRHVAGLVVQTDLGSASVELNGR